LGIDRLRIKELKIDIRKIKTVPYCCNGDPNNILSWVDKEIKKAIDSGKVEDRSFQYDLEELQKEWNNNSASIKDYCQQEQAYHINRIATLVIKNNFDPILLYKDKQTILDGQHRVLAAKYLNMSEIEAFVIDSKPPISDEIKKKLWEKINSFCGDSEKALKSLSIEYIK